MFTGTKYTCLNILIVINVFALFGFSYLCYRIENQFKLSLYLRKELNNIVGNSNCSYLRLGDVIQVQSRTITKIKEMVRNLSKNGQKTLFYVGCACVGAYVAYRYWKKRQLKIIDEGFEEVIKIDDTNERRILLLGLEGSGKTSLMNQVVVSNSQNSSYIVPPLSTHGFTVYRLQNGNYTYNVWEIGGADDTRQYWNNFLQDIDLLLFVVDASSDLHKLSLAVTTLKQVIGDSRMNNVPVLVIANKQDVPNALRLEEVKEALDLLSISPHKHKVEVIGCQTRPLPELSPGTKEYKWYHPSVVAMGRKIFAMANT